MKIFSGDLGGSFLISPFRVPFPNWLPLSLRGWVLKLFNLKQFSRISLKGKAIRLINSINLLAYRQFRGLPTEQQ